MNNTTFKTLSPLQNLLLFVVIVFVSASLFSLIGVNLASFLFGVNPDLIVDLDLKELNNIRALKLITLFTHLGIFIVPSLFFLYLTRPSIVTYFNKSFSRSLLYLLPLIFIGVSLLSEWSLWLNKRIDFDLISKGFGDSIRASQLERDKTVMAFIGGTWKSLISNILLIAIVPAIGEELVFRGVLQPLFIKMSNNRNASIIFVAFLFAFIHFQFLDFLPRFILGIIYGVIFFRTNNIWLTVILHFFNNLLALLIAFYFVNNNSEIPNESNGHIFILFVGLALTLWSIRKLKQNKV